MKTLLDVQQDMSALYDEVRDGARELKNAAELANIAGKFLKAEALILAREIFLAQRTQPVKALKEEKKLPELVVEDVLA